MLEPNRVLKTMKAVLMAFAIVAHSASAHAQGSGSLKITSFPSGAKVAIDGADTGKVTPMSVSLPVGDYVVVVSIPNAGWNSDSRTVTVVSGNNDLSVTLLPLLTVAHLDGAACTTPTGQPGSIQITQSKNGVVIFRCRVGTARFIDNGDGTITDTQTGLMWETKVAGSSCLRCAEDHYSWADAMGNWLDRLNGRLISNVSDGGFAGYSDWRLPTVAELLTILDNRFSPRLIDPIFGPTGSPLSGFGADYYTASTEAEDPHSAWRVSFHSGGGGTFYDLKGKALYVRAVRGGQ